MREVPDGFDGGVVLSVAQSEEGKYNKVTAKKEGLFSSSLCTPSNI